MPKMTPEEKALDLIRIAINAVEEAGLECVVVGAPPEQAEYFDDAEMSLRNARHELGKMWRLP